MSTAAVATATREIAHSMTVQMIRTKAEAGYIEQFEGLESELPGSPAVRKSRREALGRFATLGLPHRRIEEWKYTDLRALLKEAAAPHPAGASSVRTPDIDAALGALAGCEAYRLTFVDGRFALSLSDVERLPGALRFKPLSDALLEASGWPVDVIADEAAGNGVAALNTAFMTDGATLRIDADTALDKPLLIVFVRASATPCAVTSRTYVDFGPRAEGVLVEAHIALPGAANSSQSNTMTCLAAGEAAEVAYVRLCEEAQHGLHVANLEARLGAKAVFRPFLMTVGEGMVRHDLNVTFSGEHATLDLGGLALGSGGAHSDLSMLIDHAVRHCTSRELFKAVLAGESKGVFQGRVIVRPGAQKTDGKQMAQALMLSPQAEFDSKPELEIYADDVICGHGSTAAELDEDLLFYCRSRGIPREEARALLIESFIGEAIDKVGHEGLREALSARANSWLRAGSVAGSV